LTNRVGLSEIESSSSTAWSVFDWRQNYSTDSSTRRRPIFDVL